MILPITAYGHPTLKKVANDIDRNFPYIEELIKNMFETMYHSNGVGLAAPQVDVSARLLVIDASPYTDQYPEANNFKKVMINPYITNIEGEEWSFNEGCLSIPDIREDVVRQSTITIKHLDENFVAHEEQFSGIIARIIQHEYDHLEGILFVDRLKPFKKMLLKRKLSDISKGNIDIDYKMKFPLQNKKK